MQHCFSIIIESCHQISRMHPKTILNLSIFNWQFSQRFKGFIVDFFSASANFLLLFFRRSFWADPLTWDWYTVLFVDMPGSLCLCNWSCPLPPPLPALTPAPSLCLLSLCSWWRVTSSYFGWIRHPLFLPFLCARYFNFSITLWYSIFP